MTQTTGNIDIEMSKGDLDFTLDSTKGINVEISKGNVNFNLSDGFSGIFRCDVTKGNINHSNIDFNTQNFDTKKTLKGKIGNSDSKISVDLIKGNIIITGKKN